MDVCRYASVHCVHKLKGSYVLKRKCVHVHAVRLYLYLEVGMYDGYAHQKRAFWSGGTHPSAAVWRDRRKGLPIDCSYSCSPFVCGADGDRPFERVVSINITIISNNNGTYYYYMNINIHDY